MSKLFDIEKRDKLVTLINQLSEPNTYVTVDVDQFFDGNNCDYSIGCNLFTDHPGIAAFYQTFKQLEDHPDVDELQVAICDVDEGEWPFTDTVYVNTKLDIEAVTKLVAHLFPDDIWHCEDLEKYIPIKAGYQLLAIWWD